MEKLNILYIDDKPDADLDEYFDRYYSNDEYEKRYEMILFNPNNGYESLLQDLRVQTANIIFIDSRLFEHRTAENGKFTGEEFKMVLNKFFPYIEVIVITQNGRDPEIDMIDKYDSRDKNRTPQQYYSEAIPPCIDQAIHRIRQFRILASKIDKNDCWEKFLKEKILGTLNGINVYEELGKKDIDELINAFKILQENFNE